jgi:hypothetical protein
VSGNRCSRRSQTLDEVSEPLDNLPRGRLSNQDHLREGHRLAVWEVRFPDTESGRWVPYASRVSLASARDLVRANPVWWMGLLRGACPESTASAVFEVAIVPCGVAPRCTSDPTTWGSVVSLGWRGTGASSVRRQLDAERTRFAARCGTDDVFASEEQGFRPLSSIRRPVGTPRCPGGMRGRLVTARGQQAAVTRTGCR